MLQKVQVIFETISKSSLKAIYRYSSFISSLCLFLKSFIENISITFWIKILKSSQKYFLSDRKGYLWQNSCSNNWKYDDKNFY